MTDIAALPASVEQLPAPLRERVQHHWERYTAARQREGVVALTSPTVRESVAVVWASSEFVAQACCQFPALLVDLVGSGDLASRYAEDAHGQRLARALAEVSDERGLAVVLRQVRRREMVRIAWRDLAGWADLAETLADLSRFATACVDAALTRLDAWQAAELGEPHGADSGARQHLVVIGMGKLGAGELNYSSDIDLIFAYPDAGETRGGRSPVSNEEYFTKLGRRLIHALDARTAEGYVFRVDLRLRPFGDTGPLAMSFDAMEDYYQAHGREWERYAWIKAAVVGGERVAGERLLGVLRPFVFRRYLDFGAFESLREMKALIAQQVRRKGMRDNIKLGAGGIREVEFIGQAFQLIRGGREPKLQARAILVVLRRLSAADYLPAHVSRDLEASYVFLRRMENRLQEYADEQTHSLPGDELGRLRLAHAMGYADWTACAAELEGHRQRVHSHFEQVMAAPQMARDDTTQTPLTQVWRETDSAAAVPALLAQAGYDDVEAALRYIAALRGSASVRALSERGRGRLNDVMPLLLGAVGGAPRPSPTLGRVLGLIEKIARRTAYLALLSENPTALSQLVQLCAASPWITGQLTRQPLLLDELMDPRALYVPLDRASLQQDLAETLTRVADGDVEGQLDALRNFKETNVLRVAAADVAGRFPLMVVSDHLSEIAEVTLAAVLHLAREHLLARHGVPRCHGGDGEEREPGFAIVGYGKLGGIELGYGSDLDLVFLHDSEGEELGSDGAKPLDNPVYFARLGQRIIHICTAHTPAGVLYDVDMRLRPSGNAGMLVSSMAAFEAYQRQEAWTWEHQALVRARVVAGDARLAERFASVRREILARPRERTELRREVCEMRARMRAELGHPEPTRFDLKQDSGGIADIEFMVQYAVLAGGHEHPELLRYTDNIRQLEGLSQAGLLPAADASLLSDAYRSYRARLHRLTLQQENAVVDAEEFGEQRAQVTRIWRDLMEPA